MREQPGTEQDIIKIHGESFTSGTKQPQEQDSYTQEIIYENIM